MTTLTIGAHDAQPSWQRLLHHSALALGGALLVSALVSWVAANWAAIPPLQKLVGVQILLAALCLASWCLAWRGQTSASRHAVTLLSSLMGIGIGALLALVGQQYQTGADAWQLFFWWSVLLLPWLVILRTVLLALLWIVLINATLGLLLLNGAWLFAPLSMMLLAVLVNAILLGLLEGFGARLRDVWRIGPRATLAALLVWLIAAQLQSLSHWVALLGLGVLASVAYGYARWRFDLAMLSLGALYALVWVVTTAFLNLHLRLDASSLLVLVLILLAMVISTLTWFRRLHAQHLPAASGAQALPTPGEATLPRVWYVSAFRTAALWLIAWVLVAFLFLLFDPSLDPEHNTVSMLGGCTTAIGVLLLIFLRSPAWREIAAAVAAAGFTLVCMPFLFSEGAKFAALILLVGTAVYTLGNHVALRFLCASMSAIFVLGLTGHSVWNDVTHSLLGGRALPDAAPLYLRLWLLTAGTVTCLWLQRNRSENTLLPLAWALALTAQTLAWAAPADWSMDAGVAALRAGFVLLPAALLWGAWRYSPPDLAVNTRRASLAALLAVSAAWLGAPGIALGLSWWLLGFALARREWMALGALSVLVYLWRFYYDLSISLLDKAGLLAAVGLCLLLGAWGLARTVRGGKPPQPSPRAGRIVLLGLPAALALVLGFVNLDIARKETLLRDGARVVLELAPIDPRSLMQGDYMALDYVVNRQARERLYRAAAMPSSGDVFVLQADARGVHQLAAIQADVAPRQPGQIAMRARKRFQEPVIGVHSYFFPEGQAAHFAQARYGEYRVSPTGQSLLLRLLDANLQPL